MNALFVLAPPDGSFDAVLAAAPSQLQRELARLRHRRYPAADDGAHLASLVRSLRDPAAVTWRSGMVMAIATGALLGGITNAVLAAWFGMFGGLLDVAANLGIAGGAFLGGISASMRGTERPRPEVASLLPHVRGGDVLLSWSGPDVESLRQLQRLCDARGLPTALRS